MNPAVQQVIDHKNACVKLYDELLHQVPQFDCVRCGSDGKQNLVLIVSLVTSPPEGWEVPFREFEGFSVVWKVVNRVFAL